MKLMMALMAGVAVSSATPLTVVNNLDPARYLGTWYEIARFPNKFQDQCIGDVTATYTAAANGGLTVVNRCKERSGKITEATGVARRVRGAPPSVLEVRFAPAFLSFLPQVWGDYQVIALDDAHTYSVVGTPDRKYLWILARTPALDPATYDRLAGLASGQGFDVKKLVKTPQSTR